MSPIFEDDRMFDGNGKLVKMSPCRCAECTKRHIKNEKQKQINIAVGKMIIGVALHDHLCQNCGRIATINYQSVWHTYSIDMEGKFRQIETTNVDENNFFCDRCYHEEIKGWSKEDLDRNFIRGVLNDTLS